MACAAGAPCLLPQAAGRRGWEPSPGLPLPFGGWWRGSGRTGSTAGSSNLEEAAGKSQCKPHSPAPGAGIQPSGGPWGRAHRGHGTQLAAKQTASISPSMGRERSRHGGYRLLWSTWLTTNMPRVPCQPLRSWAPSAPRVLQTPGTPLAPRVEHAANT